MGSFLREYCLWALKFVTAVVVVVSVPVFVVAILITGLSELGSIDQLTAELESPHQVAVVELTGEIVSADEVLSQLHEAAAREKIAGIVLRVDSPGGAVAPSQEIYAAADKIKKIKPIVVSMGDVAASGGLYASLAASKVYCQPGTITGSIGVIMQLPNLTKIAEKVGLDMVTIKSGDLKDVGNQFREMTEKERRYLQQTIDLTYLEFKQAVATSRNIDLKKVSEFADGRIIIGTQAKAIGLVDDFGDKYDAARAVFALKGTPLPEGVLPVLVPMVSDLAQLKRMLKATVNWPGRLLKIGLVAKLG